MAYFFGLLALPLYLAWFCLGHVTQRPGLGGRTSPYAYTGVLVGWAGILLPVPWLALHALLPTVPAWLVIMWLVVLLCWILYPLSRWLLRYHSVPALRRGLLWTTDASVLAWLLYRWL